MKYKLFLPLVAFLLWNAVFVFSQGGLYQPVYIDSHDFWWDSSIRVITESSLDLPTEGEAAILQFELIPAVHILDEESISVYSRLYNPQGDLYAWDLQFFEKGPYATKQKYTVSSDYYFDVPGTWELRYIFFGPGRYGEFSQEERNQFFLNKSIVYSKNIRVLSFYEAQSLIISNNSLIIAKLGLLGGFVGFIFGLFGYYLIDYLKYRRKIKINCSWGLVTYTPSKIVFTIEVINYGRTAVTLSSAGIELEDNKILHILESEIRPLEFPKELPPGKSYSIHKEYDNLKNSLKDKNPKRAFVRDQTNKKYYSKNIRRFFSEEVKQEH